MQRIREKIVEQEAEHIKLVDENNKLKTEKQITVSELVVDSWDFHCDMLENEQSIYGFHLNFNALFKADAYDEMQTMKSLRFPSDILGYFICNLEASLTYLGGITEIIVFQNTLFFE